MRVRVCSGRKIRFRDATYTTGGVIDAPDDIASEWVAAGDAKATLRAKPVTAPRPLQPDSQQRAHGK